ncbi:cupin domain-containing protein [Mesorhizobium sp. AR10]|uniref:cupin domain-containing protein n=1 Tax=Mesorhizobium sp. AR10 TaxID=2865839 RepID=UPI0029E811FA|nr:cupin domain-containing protein [Mesorhizobium sp. AR10]
MARPWTTLRAGDVLFVPAGVVHTARNASADPASLRLISSRKDNRSLRWLPDA